MRVLRVSAGAVGLAGTMASAQSSWIDSSSTNQWSSSSSWTGGVPQNGYSVTIDGQEILPLNANVAADSVSVSLSSLSTEYAAINLSSSDIAVTGKLTGSGTGITTSANSTLSASTATFSGVPNHFPSLYLAGIANFSTSLTFSGGDITNTGVFSANAFSLQSSHSLPAFYNTGSATFTGSFSFIGAQYNTTDSYVDSDGASAVINLSMAAGAATVNNGILEATNGGQVTGATSALTITQGGVLTANGGTVNLTATTVTNEFQSQAFGVQPYENSIISATNSGQLTINATNLTNTYSYTPGDAVTGNSLIEASTGGTVTVNVTGTLTNNAYIEADAGGTVNVNAANMNGSGALNATGANAQLNVKGGIIYGQYVDTLIGGVANVGTLSSPVAQFNEGGLISDDSMYGESFGSGTQIQAYITNFNGLITSAMLDFVGASDGAITTLNGSTYVGSTIFSRVSYANGQASTVDVTESTSVGGLGYIYALGNPTPSTTSNEVDISAPTITLDYPEIETGLHNQIFLDASTSLTLDDNGTYTSFNYNSTPASVLAAGGEILLQSPDIQISGTSASPILLQAINNDGLLKINAIGPAGQVSITNQGVASLQTASAQTGSIEIDGAQVVNGLNSYLVAGESGGSIVFNNSNATGLDSQNAGTLSAVIGSIVVGGSTFENESTGLISIAQIGNLYLGYTLAAPGSTPAVSSELLSSANSGTIDVYGTLTSNGTLANEGTGTISAYDYGSTDFYNYLPATINVTSGDFNNAGLTTLSGSDLTVGPGSLINSGTLTASDDLSAPTNPLGSFITANGDFQNSGTVTLAGSQAVVFGTLTNTGTFTVQDDPSGGVAYGNNYPDQPSTLTLAGGLDNTGITANLTIQNSNLGAPGTASITNENGATLTLLDSSFGTLNGPLNNESGASFTVTGGLTELGIGTTPAAVALSNTGGATFLIDNDYSAVAGGGLTNAGTVIVSVGDVQNSSTATLEVLGGSLSLNGGNFVNSTGAKFEVYDDLSQGSSVGPVGGSATVEQSLTNSSGALVDVMGSSLTVQDALTNNGGTVNVRDDNSGGAAFGNSYSTQYGSLEVNVGDLTNEGGGSFTVTESTVYVIGGTLTNRDNSTFTVQDDSTLAQPTGATLGVYGPGGIVNTDTATFNVIGGSVSTNATITNEGSATFTVSSDDTAEVSSGGAASIVTGAVSASSISNSDNANFKVIGGSVYASSFTNSGNGVVTVDGLADGNQSGFVELNGQFANGTSQTDAAKMNVINGTVYFGTAGSYFQTGVNSKTYVGLQGEIYGPGQTFSLGNPGDPAGSGGYLGGSGTVDMNVDDNAGTIDPGDPQSLSIIGDLTMGPNGTLAFNLDGPGGPGVGYDALFVDGNVTLAGTLDLIFGPGFNPSGSFDILNVTGGTISGDFSTLEETINGNTTILHGNIVIGPGGITYQAVPEPAPWLVFAGATLGVLCRRRKKTR